MVVRSVGQRRNLQRRARTNLPVGYSADLYDRYTDGFVAAYDDRLIRRVREEYRFMGRGRRCLIDVGTGTAQLLVRLACQRGLGGIRLIGTDFFEAMVAKATETVRRHGLQDRIRIEKGDVHALPYPDRFADLVVSRSTIHHWADPVRGFGEIYRVLKPGGVAILHEPRRDPDPTALAEFNRRRRQAGVPPTTLDEKYTPDEVRSFLKAAGLRRQGIVTAPKAGPGSLGFEVRISKCHPIRVYLAASVARIRSYLKS